MLMPPLSRSAGAMAFVKAAYLYTMFGTDICG